MPIILHNFNLNNLSLDKLSLDNFKSQTKSQLKSISNTLFQDIEVDNSFHSKSEIQNIENNTKNPIDLESFIDKALNYTNLLSSDFSHYLVVPTYKQSENLDKELTRKYFEIHKTPNPNFNITNFLKFVLNLFEEVVEKDKYIFINDTIQLSLIEETLYEIIKNNNISNLKFYKAEILLKNPENLLKLKNAISGLRKKGLTAQNLRNDYEKYHSILEDEKFNPKNTSNSIDEESNTIYSINNIDKLSDFCYILEKYEEKLSHNLLDYLAMVELICKKLIELKPQIDEIKSTQTRLKFKQLKLKKFFENSFLFFGFTHFELPDIKLLHSLKDAGFELCIHFDTNKSNQQLFEIINSDIEQIMSFNSNNQFHKYEINQNNENSTENFIKQNLFQQNNSTSELKTLNLFKNTQIYKVKNKFSEVEYISRLCKILLNDTELKLQPKDIVISSRNPHKYADIFREIGLKNQVNFNISDRYELKKSRLVSEIITFFDVLKSNFTVTKYENNIQKLKSFYYLNFDKKVINLFYLNRFFENRAIIFGNSQKHILQKLIEIRLEIIKVNENENRLEFINPKIKGIVEGNKYQSAQNELDKINKAILETVGIVNYFNIFDIESLKYTSNNIEEFYFINEIDEELYNLLYEENRFVKEGKFYIKYYNYDKLFQTLYDINDFEKIIRNTIKKHKVLQQILSLRELIISDSLTFSENTLDLENLELDNLDFDNIDFDNIDFENLDLENLNFGEQNNKDLGVNELNNQNLDTSSNSKLNTSSNAELIKQFSFIKKNIKPNVYENLENDFKAFKNFFKAISELKNIIQIKQNYNIQINIRQNENNQILPHIEKDSFSNYYDKLKIIISNTKYQISERRNKAIKVTSIEQTRGIDYKVNILCGLTDGEFPMPFQSDKVIGKDLENSQVIFQNNEKMQLYHYFINGAKYYETNEKLNFIFIPKYNENTQLLDSIFIDNIVDLLHTANGNDAIALKENLKAKDIIKQKNVLKSRYIVELDNNIDEKKIEEVKRICIDKNPFITRWVEKLLNENINVSYNFNQSFNSNNQKKYKYQLDLEKFRQNKVQQFQLDELNILGKLFKLETSIHSISNLNYLIDNFREVKDSTNSYNPYNSSDEKSLFANKTQEFINKFLEIKTNESISNSIEKKDKGTYFHNSIEVLIKYLRYIKLNKLDSNLKEIYKRNAEIELTQDVINALKINFAEMLNQNSSINNEEITIEADNAEVLNNQKDNSTLSKVNENINSIINELINEKVTKNNIINLVHYNLNSQLLKKFPKNIYLNFISELYLEHTKQFIDFLSEYSSLGRNILFSELELKMIEDEYEIKLVNILKDNINKNLGEELIHNDIFNIENLKLKYTGRSDLICFNEILDSKFFEIVDMKFKASKKSNDKKNTQLFLYFIALNNLLAKNIQAENEKLTAKETTHFYIEKNIDKAVSSNNFILFFDQEQHAKNEKSIAKNLATKKPKSIQEITVTPFNELNVGEFITTNEYDISNALSNLIFNNIEFNYFK